MIKSHVTVSLMREGEDGTIRHIGWIK